MLELVKHIDVALYTEDFLLRVFDCCDCLLPCVDDIIQREAYGILISRVMTEVQDSATLRCVKSFVCLCRDEETDSVCAQEQRLILNCLPKVSCGLLSLMKNSLPPEQRHYMFKSLSAIFSLCGLHWGAAATHTQAQILRLFPRLACVEMRLYMEDVLSQISDAAYSHTSESTATPTAAIAGAAFHSIERLVVCLINEENVQFCEEHLQLAVINDIFNGLHVCLRTVFEFVNEMSHLGIDADISQDCKQRIYYTLILTSRLICGWSCAEPKKFQSEFVGCLSFFAKHLEAKDFCVFFTPLFDADIEEWSQQEGVLLHIMDFIVDSVLETTFVPERRHEWPQAVASANALFTAVIINPYILLYKNLCNKNEKLTSYIQKLHNSVELLEQSAAMAGLLKEVDISARLGGHHGTLTNVPLSCPPTLAFEEGEAKDPSALTKNAHLCVLGAEILYLRSVLTCSEDLRYKVNKTDEEWRLYLQAVDLRITSAALMGPRLSQQFVLKNAHKQSRVAEIWDGVCEDFIVLTPTATSKYTEFNSDKISLWFRLGRIIASSATNHSILTNSLFAATQNKNVSTYIKATRTKMSNDLNQLKWEHLLPPPPKPSAESDFGSEDEEMILFFRQLFATESFFSA